jgi:hypothetical protein
MAKGGFSRCAIEETQQLIKKPRAEVREEKKARSCVSWAEEGEGYDGKTPSNGLQKSYSRLPSMPKWYSKESADTPEVQRNCCT